MSKAEYFFDKIARQDPAKRDVAIRTIDFEEIFQPFDQDTLLSQASRCITCGIPQCQIGCPLNNRISDWMEMIADGHFSEAARIAYRTNPLPDVTGRVCPRDRLCEASCAVASQFKAVTIGEAERFISERHFAETVSEVNAGIVKNGVKVAVVGSGPAGISCADFLSRMGYAVTVFEKDPQPGGFLYYGIPSFKLNKEIVDRRIRALQERGIEFRCGTELGKDVTRGELKAHGYKAFFLGLGARKQIDIPAIEGRALDNIVTAYELLRAQNSGASLPVELKGQRVLVLGGGDTAMDCARTALRKGAKEVLCVYRESEVIRPGSKREYESAIEEGVKMMANYAPVQFLGGQDGKVKEVRFIKIDSSETDGGGRFLFREIAGQFWNCEADVAVISFGFVPQAAEFLKAAEIETDACKRIVVDKQGMTNIEGVFAGGDIARGSALVVYALRDGREAAYAIDRYLNPEA